MQQTAFGGALGDRIAKKRILQWTDGLQCSLSVAWGLSLLWREPSLSEFYVFAILSGLVHAFFAPAYSSLLPELIRRQQVSRAIAVNLLVFRLAAVVAPMIGGWLVITLPFAAIILVNALSYGVAFISNQFRECWSDDHFAPLHNTTARPLMLDELFVVKTLNRFAGQCRRRRFLLSRRKRSVSERYRSIGIVY